MTATHQGVARCLDITRLISRVGRGPFTGVDRVELAYLRRLAVGDLPAFGLCRTGLGFVLLDVDGLRKVLARVEGTVPWGAVDILGRLSRKAHPLKRSAEADLRRLAIARCFRGGLAGMLKRCLPVGTEYLNVGHSGLTAASLSAWNSVEKSQVSVLVHDLIPLDFPEYQRDGTVAAFEAKMRAVAQYADRVICISGPTRLRVLHWFSKWGCELPTVVAHLGVDVPPVIAAELPDELRLPGPYFVAVGTIEPRKNHALLLDIWDQLGPDAPTLVIAGSRGWKNADVFRRLDAKPPHVIEAPGLSDGALGALIKGASGLLFPTHAEGFGLPPAEALALGTPVICSNLQVFHEILGNKPIYAESDDMYLWKQSIEGLIEKGSTEHNGKASEAVSFNAPTWADHFNLVLKLT